MKNTQSINFVFIVFALSGCATSVLPEFETVPEPPSAWNIVLEKSFGCPDATGEYELTPKTAVLQSGGLWNISNGNWYDFLLLIPFNRVTAVKWNPGENPLVYSPDTLMFELKDEGESLQIVSPDKNNENLVAHVFNKDENDYKCQAGNLIFPEFQIQGGSEGSFLSGKIYRQATKTSAGDLLFYEQVQSHEVIHRYYLFKMKNSQDALG